MKQALCSSIDDGRPVAASEPCKGDSSPKFYCIRQYYMINGESRKSCSGGPQLVQDKSRFIATCSYSTDIYENDMDTQFDDLITQKKRRHNNKDPSANADKDTKKRRRKDTEPSNKEKDLAGSSNKGKALSKSSKYDKNVNAEESVQDAAMDVEESMEDDVVNIGDPTKVDVVPKQETPNGFSNSYKKDLETS
ncbi:hypothetical protein Tco_0701917 [Tanacetum coccineum]|uniref:Uncharacterized protein n=1 Tax=Tanacetum coccineum TaxID=301880 RepID=A0ABQ4XW56_9ASTR